MEIRIFLIFSVLMKMDVEGSELELLLDLLTSGSLQYIDRVLVEYHPYFQVDNLSNKR